MFEACVLKMLYTTDQQDLSLEACEILCAGENLASGF
jgi:hypothetical protein